MPEVALKVQNNVLDYCRKVTGIVLDESYGTLPITSVCGKDCKKAIDAAHKMAKIAAMASPEYGESIYATMTDVCNVFWFG